jgi:Ran GTPase-activating protein (RanGAP) involved in mRNA processing and transport
MATRTLKTLDLGANKLSPAVQTYSLQVISRGLALNNTVTEFSLHGNVIGSEGCAIFAEALKDNRTVSTLDLRDNKLAGVWYNNNGPNLKPGDKAKGAGTLGRQGTYDSSGVKSLISVVGANPSLKVLNLGWNDLGSDVGKALAAAMRQDTCGLTMLECRWNSFGEAAEKEMKDAASQRRKFSLRL